MRATGVVILLLMACATRSNNNDDDYCPNADCILHLCECGSSSCSSDAPQSCGSDAECGSGEQCSDEIDDTEQCNVTCNGDGTGCPDGYFCQTFIP